MLLAGGQAATEQEAQALLQEALDSGRGLAKLKEMIAAQGGDPQVCDDTGRLPQAALKTEVRAKRSGFIHSMKTEQLGLAAQALGAGRLRKEDQLDYAAGYILFKRIGDAVKKGEPLAVLHHSDKAPAGKAAAMLEDAIAITEAQPPKPTLIHALIARDGKETSWN